MSLPEKARFEALAKAAFDRAIALRGVAIEVLRYPVHDTLMDKGTNWSAVPALTASVLGDLQPAGTEAQVRFGLTVKAGRYLVFCQQASLSPATDRLRASGKLYAVLGLEDWGSHLEIMAEEV